MDISRPCQPEKLIPLLPWPGFDPSFSGHNDRRAIISEWTRLHFSRSAIGDGKLIYRGPNTVFCGRMGGVNRTRAKPLYDVPSGGGTGRGEIRKCLELDDFLSTLKSVFCKAILYINIYNTHFELQNCKKNRYSLFQARSTERGGGTFFAKPLYEARSAKRGWDREGVSPLPR